MAIQWDDKHFRVVDIGHHNADINILLSGREAGKSTALVYFLLNLYMKDKKSKFVWLLRQKSQLNKMFYQTFLNDFEDYPFVMAKNQVFYYDKKKMLHPNYDDPIGFFGAVSTGNKDFKQTKLKDVRNIVYDEFLIDHTLPNEKYLNKEAEVLFKIWDTIQRRAGRKTRLWLLGNPYSMINPYFRWLGIESKEVEKRQDKIYKPFGNRILIYYFSVHPDLLEQKESTTYGFFSKKNDEYYRHTFQSEVKYKPMFPTMKFDKINNKKYIFKVKIDNTMLEFWDVEYGIFIAEKEYKKDNAIALDFDSFEGNAVLNNRDHPLYDLIKRIQGMVSNRLDVIIESSNIENAVKLFAKQR